MTNKKIVWGSPPSGNISLNDCEWYHVMEIPGIEGLTDGVFDCRDDIGNILGNLDFKDKKILNLGPSTGYLSFEAERRGANVTSIDLSINSEERDWTPIADQDWKTNLKSFMGDEKRRRNAFWYAHKALNSKSKLIISHINNLPEEVEMHDIGVIFSVMLHIRDPFLALQRMCSHVNEKIVITELGQYPTYAYKLLPASKVISIKDFLARFYKKNYNLLNKLPNFISKRFIGKPPTIRFLPQHGRIASKWWAFTPEAIIAMLKVLGFEKTEVNYHYYKMASKNNDGFKVWNFTVIGERTIPIEKCEYRYDAN